MEPSERIAMEPATGPVARSPAAERMRRYRDRRNKGLRCLTIDVRETEIDELIRKGFLKSETRNNTNSIIEALYAHLDHTLGPIP
jgi:hypothetical protein